MDAFDKQVALWKVLYPFFLLCLFIGTFIPTLYAALPGVFGLAAFAGYSHAGLRFPAIEKSMPIWIGLLGILFLATLPLAHNAGESLERSIKILCLALTCVPLVYVLRDMPFSARQSIGKWLPVILTFQAIILGIEIYYNFPISKYLRGLGDAAIAPHVVNKHGSVIVMLFPFAAYFSLVMKRYLIFSIMSAAVLFVVFHTWSQAAQLAYIVMFLSGLLVFFAKNHALKATYAILATLLVSLPFLSSYLMAMFAGKAENSGGIVAEASTAMRLEVYEFISKKIMEAPFLGHGIDATRFMTFSSDKKYFPSDTIMHPHNIILQIWLEFGLAGVLFFGALLTFVFMKMLKKTGIEKYFSYTVFCMIMVFLMISWSMWASWLVGFVFSMLALLQIIRNDDASAY